MNDNDSHVLVAESEDGAACRLGTRVVTSTTPISRSEKEGVKRCIGGFSRGFKPQNCNGAGWDPGCVGGGVVRRDLAGLMMCDFDFDPDETRFLLSFALLCFALLCLFVKPTLQRDLYHVCQTASESGDARFGID